MTNTTSIRESAGLVSIEIPMLPPYAFSQNPERVTGFIVKDASFRKDLILMTFPAHLKQGIYIVPITLASDLNALLCSWSEHREEVTGLMLTTMGEDCASAARYRLRWQYITLCPPPPMPTDLLEQEQVKITEYWARAFVRCRADLRSELEGTLGRTLDMMKPDPSGRGRNFHDSNLTKLSDLLRLLPKKNITGDDQLLLAVAEVSRIIQDLTGEAIRTHNDVRLLVYGQLQEALLRFKAADEASAGNDTE